MIYLKCVIHLFKHVKCVKYLFKNYLHIYLFNISNVSHITSCFTYYNYLFIKIMKY